MMSNMRWMLAIDTCGNAGSVALMELFAEGAEYRVAAERTLPGRETQEQLMVAIAEVLAVEGLTPGVVDVLGVVTGPGSFTGVRIGLAAVKGLAEALGSPVVAVSRLAVLAAQADEAGAVTAWLDAGRGDVFVGRYVDGVCRDEWMATGLDAVEALTAGEPLVVMEEALAARADDARLVPAVGVREALPLLVRRVHVQDFADIALLDANYLRVPDAELARLRAMVHG
jgi:tRNA threonylcarbamoyladenosine biosynthesis protein TsaB